MTRVRLYLRLLTLMLAVAAAALWCGGCAKYQFEIAEPAEFAQAVTRAPVEVRIEPLEYRLRAIDRQLVIRILNPNQEPATIHGERSYLVDPEGETHPLRGGTIAPSSYITIGLPPLARYYRTGPRFGFGIGVGTSFHTRHFYHDHFYHDHFYHPYGDDPFYYSRFDYPLYYDVPTWRWKTGDVRLRVIGTIGEDAFDHEFLLRRVRIN